MPPGEYHGGRRRPRAYNRFRPLSGSGRHRRSRYNIRRHSKVDCTRDLAGARCTEQTGGYFLLRDGYGRGRFGVIVRGRRLADRLYASLKTFTGTVPFDLHLSTTVALAIMRGDRPERPVHPELTDGLWELIRRCWSQEPHSRPNMSKVLDVLHGR